MIQSLFIDQNICDHYNRCIGVCYIRELRNILHVYSTTYINLSESNEKPTIDNIDSYMLKLQ